MLADSTKQKNIMDLPVPERSRPKKVVDSNNEIASEKESYPIAEFQLTGPQWVRLLSLMCSVISDDEYSDLEVAKVAAKNIDDHLQGSPKFKTEVQNLMKYGGPEVQLLVEKLKLPPWDR
jgi:hypothetical protein